MVGATSPRARLAQRLLSFVLASALIAEPALGSAGPRQCGRSCGPGDDQRGGERRRAVGGCRKFQPRRARKAAGPDRPLSRPAAGADSAGERLSGADRPGASLARQEPGPRRKQRFLRNRQPELGSGGEGARALSGRDQDDERGSRLDNGSGRRGSEPAPGRRRRHPRAARQGANRPTRSRRPRNRRSRPPSKRSRPRAGGALKRLTSKSSRPTRRRSTFPPTTRSRSMSPIPASRLFWASGPASRSARCGTTTTGTGERARSIRRSGPAIRAGVRPTPAGGPASRSARAAGAATSTPATSISEITSTSATT